ncbi:hypothetical protein AB5N19_10002 [Seiridium cardinale]
MKTSFAITAITAILATASAMPSSDILADTPAKRDNKSVTDLFNGLNKPSDGHGHQELTADGKVTQYDSDGNVVDQTTASIEALQDFYNKFPDRDIAGTNAATNRSRRDEGFAFDLAKRTSCTAYPCVEDDDCKVYKCYGGCRQTPLIPYLRCYP